MGHLGDAGVESFAGGGMCWCAGWGREDARKIKKNMLRVLVVLDEHERGVLPVGLQLSPSIHQTTCVYTCLDN